MTANGVVRPQRFGRFVALIVGVLVVAGALLSLLFHGPGDVGAICISAGITLVVQLAAFWLAGLPALDNVMARMGLGALLRFGTLVVYAVLVAKVFTLPLVAALLSLAAFFALTTLIEPLFLKS